MERLEVLKAKVDFHKTWMFSLLILNVIVLLSWGVNITGSSNRLAFFIASIVLLVLFFVSFMHYYKRYRELVRLGQ